MRSRWRQFGGWLLVALAANPAGAAMAGGRDEDLFVRPEDQYTVLFGSLDAGRSVFVNAGAKQTVTGPLDRTGFVTMEAWGYGLTQERYRGAADLPATRFTQQVGILTGFQWALNGLYAAAYLGPEVQHEQLTIDGQVFRFSKPRYGVRGQVEIWANPTADTLLTATLVAGTARFSLWGRGSAGIRVASSTFVGPEVTAYVTPTYSEIRVGAHVTGASVGLVQLRLSGGWMIDDAHRAGSPYGGLTLWMRM